MGVTQKSNFDPHCKGPDWKSEQGWKFDKIENYFDVIYVCFIGKIHVLKIIYFQKLHSQLFKWNLLKQPPSDWKIEESPINYKVKFI